VPIIREPKLSQRVAIRYKVDCSCKKKETCFCKQVWYWGTILDIIVPGERYKIQFDEEDNSVEEDFHPDDQDWKLFN
jgi:hypothetical protein